MNILEKALVGELEKEIFPGLLKSYQIGMFDRLYFITAEFCKTVYQELGFNRNAKLCEELFNEGFGKNPLTFEELSECKRIGEEQGEQTLLLAKEGRKYVELDTGGKVTVH